MAAILKIAFLVCLVFFSLAPNCVRALVCVHCVSKDLNVTEAEECIGKENMKYGGADCSSPANSTICKMISITHNEKTDMARGCVNKPTEFAKPCCTMLEDRANSETNLTAPIPYWVCFCDKDNCNNMTGEISNDKLPAGFNACLKPEGILVTGPPGPLPLGVGGGNESNSSQDHPRSFSLAVLGALCLSVLVVNHDNLQY